MQPAANRRLLRGILAFLGTAAMRVAVQVATLPILFAAWSPERVGGWLLLFALPTYFAVVGQAFSGAGGNVALAAAQKGQWEEARSAMRASWLAATGITLALLAAMLVPALVYGSQLADSLGVAGTNELLATLPWLGLYVLALGQTAAIGIAYRIAGRYPQFILWNSAITLAEVAVLAGCVLVSDSYVPLAASLALLRVVFAAAQFGYSRRAAPALFAARAARPKQHLRELIKPTLAFIMLPVVYAMNLQGYTLLVGTLYGAAVLAAFVATRTIVRVIDLVTNTMFGIQFLEAGYLGDNKAEIQRRQLATMTLAALLVALGFAAVLLVAGPWIQQAFTVGKTAFDYDIAIVLLASGTIRALAVTPQAIVSAENRHSTFVGTYLAGSLASFALALALAATGAPLAFVLAMLIPAELSQAIPAMRSALRQVGTDWPTFLASLASRQRIADVTDLIRFLRERPATD